MGKGEGRKKKKPENVPNIPGMAPSQPSGDSAPRPPQPRQQQQAPRQQQSSEDAGHWQQPGPSGWGLPQQPRPRQVQAEKPKETPSPVPAPAPTVSSVSRSMADMKVKSPTPDKGLGLNPPKKRLPQDGQSRPSFPGAEGRPISLRVNHLPIHIKDMLVYQYSVQIKTPWNRPYKKTDKDVYQLIINAWRQLNVVAKKDPYSWVFDGHSTLYCPHAYKDIPNTEVSLDVSLDLDGKMTTFQVEDVKVDCTIQITQDLAAWAAGGTSGSMPQSTLSAINTVLSQARILNFNYTNLGRSFFRNDGTVIDLGFGKEAWTGIFSSVRPCSWTDKGTKFLLTLNANVANKAASKSLHLVHKPNERSSSYIDEILDRGGAGWRNGISPQQRGIIARDLKGLKVKYTLPNGNKREYRVNDVMDSANKLMIPDLKMTVEQYFLKEHSKHIKKLQYPHLPCLWLGSRNKTIYIPFEFCEVSSQSLPQTKQLPERAQATMIKQTAMKPGDRERKILEELRQNNNIHKDDPFAKSFKISIADHLLELKARILPPPSIEYQGKKVVNIDDKNPGSWWNRGTRYLNGSNIQNWAILDLANLTDRDHRDVVAGFVREGGFVGVKFNPQSGQRYKSTDYDVGKEFAKIVKGKPDLIVVILKFKGGKVYNEIKQLGDIKYKVPTQCVVQNTLFRKDFKTGQVSINGQVIGNLCLKINSKLSGTNHMLAQGSKPAIFKEPVMILGADVTHAAAQFKDQKPSIAAVVGSMDPTAQMKYEVEIRVQDSLQNEEMINEMKNMVKSLLLKFLRTTKYKPRKLIMFRDGVSEGQFQSVMARELMAIRAACSELETNGGYQPEITYVVVQKRHHTRFFPSDNNKYQKNGNALAGTVVDQGINHPTEGDYYLLSHEGIQGTSRPCHYQVLWDDSNFSADELEKLSYYLCHLYARCTRSVSYPAPTYNSHLAADRARKHHDYLMEKRTSPQEAKKILETAETPAMYFV